MLQFWNVLLLFPVPRLAVLIVLLPEPTPNSVYVLPLPTRFTFFTTLLVAPSAVAVCSQITADDVPVFVFVIVRSRVVPPTVFEPSMMIQSAPFSVNKAVALEP